MPPGVCRWLGVSSIGLVENSKTLTHALEERLAPYVESGFVHLEAWGDDTPAQIKIFHSCFTKFKKTHDWVAFFDADEYLMLLERCGWLHSGVPFCMRFMIVLWGLPLLLPVRV